MSETYKQLVRRWFEKVWMTRLPKGPRPGTPER
jgi:hypothetical protein